jgi:uncharacterized membrane protein YkgB
MSRPITAAGTLADSKYSRALDTATGVLLRYGLVLLILWIGVFKFTPTEAKAIEPLLANSPLLAWLLAVAGVDGASRIIGTSEIVIAALLAVRPLWPRLSIAGSIGAIGMFLTTLSFLVTTPGSWRVVDGLLVPAGGGFFILKDVVLLGAACWTAADAMKAVGRPEVV